MKESEIKRKLRKKLREMSPKIEEMITAIPASRFSTGGIPDWLIDYKGKALWIEFKQGKNATLTARQKNFLKKRPDTAIIIHYLKKENDKKHQTILYNYKRDTIQTIIVADKQKIIEALAKTLIKIIKGGKK